MFILRAKHATGSEEEKLTFLLLRSDTRKKKSVFAAKATKTAANKITDADLNLKSLWHLIFYRIMFNIHVFKNA